MIESLDIVPDSTIELTLTPNSPRWGELLGLPHTALLDAVLTWEKTFAELRTSVNDLLKRLEDG